MSKISFDWIINVLVHVVPARNEMDMWRLGRASVHQTVRLATIKTRLDQLLLFWRRRSASMILRKPLIVRAVPQL